MLVCLSVPSAKFFPKMILLNDTNCILYVLAHLHLLIKNCNYSLLCSMNILSLEGHTEYIHMHM